MQTSFAIAALAAVAFAAPAPAPQAPTTPAPAGCAASYNGKFQIAAVNVTSSGKRSIEARQSTCGAPGSLTLTLKDTVLLDAQGRIGAIVANRQFQFDTPPQAGTIYASGFSACANSTLAIGGSAIFYQCLSGSFYNLYDTNFAVHCNAVYLQIQPCSAGGSGSSPGGVGQIGDGQATATGQGAVTQIGDGQVQAPTGRPITQIGDGQIQAPTGKAPVITQIGDGQVQAPTGKAPVVTQIGDGQIQAPKPTTTAKAPVITQISDGQIQAPTAKPSSTSAKAPVITQIADGQIQAPTNATKTPIQFTGAASSTGFSSAFAVVGLGLVSFLLL